MQAGIAMRRRILFPGGTPALSRPEGRPLHLAVAGPKPGRYNRINKLRLAKLIVSPWTHPWRWRDYSNGSRREGIACKALFRAAVSFPPASAKSGLPPPE